MLVNVINMNLDQNYIPSLNDLFIQACTDGNLKLVEEFTRAPNRYLNITAGITIACEKGYFNIVNYLLSTGQLFPTVDIIETFSNNKTLINIAEKNRDAKMLGLLLLKYAHGPSG